MTQTFKLIVLKRQQLFFTVQTHKWTWTKLYSECHIVNMLINKKDFTILYYINVLNVFDWCIGTCLNVYSL